MRRVLLIPIGSSGDVNPFLWVGRHLTALGHEVSVLANPYFATAISAAGLRHIPLGEESEYHALTGDPVIWHATKGPPHVLRYAGEVTARYFEAIRETLGDHPRDWLLLTPSTAFGARLAREILGVKLVTINLQPGIFLSRWDTFYFGRGFEFVDTLPHTLKRLLFQIVRARINSGLAPGVRRACKALGFPPPRNPFRDWWQSPDGSICLFPEWFARPQPDWPPVTCVGFPLEDLAAHHETNPALEAFLAAGAPPVLFTPGTAMAHGADFFAAAKDGCVASGRRALFITRYPDQLPAGLPDTIAHFSYVPFSMVLPRCAAIVHHGGIGTTSQALAADIPQVFVPMAHDQPDNARRVSRLHAGTWIWPRDFHAASLNAALDALISDAATARACESLARKVSAARPAEALLAALSPLLSE